MGVEQYADHLDTPAILAALLDEFSAVTDYRTLRDNLPRRLAVLLHCRCILFYQHSGETLQFASGSFADQPGWSSTLLAVAHINPIELSSDMPEALAWRARQAVVAPLSGSEQALVCAPLIYRQRTVGVLSAVRGLPERNEGGDGLAPPRRPGSWSPEELPMVAVTANVVAMLLENTRLLERDRERIQELSLLNGITSQMNCSLYERTRVRRIVVQRAREIAGVDLCEVILPGPKGATLEESSWIPQELGTQLLQHWQGDRHDTPLTLERVGEAQTADYLHYLSPRVKTFFALPLPGNRERNRPGSSTLPYTRSTDEQGAVLGVIVGAYHRPWKLRREELVLLQILANQASAVLENILLMDDVVEARNEARQLLRQVLDDQRLKELILESIPSGLITLDMHGQIMTVNRAAEAALGYHPLEIVGQAVWKVLDLRCLEQVLRTGQAQHEVLQTRGRCGAEVVLDVSLAPLRDDRGEQIGVLTTFADVTTMHHLEEEKRRLDRLASLGEMSASVAHEVRNPLASIKTSMQMLRDDLESNAAVPANEGVQDEISVVLKEVERLDSIVHDLLLFSRPRHQHLIECDLGALSQRILHFLQPQCDERGVRTRLSYQDLPPAHIDAAQMEQVLLNLFLNALQAMPEGGILSVAGQLISSRVPEGIASLYPAVRSSPVRIAADRLSRAEEESSPRSGYEPPEGRGSQEPQLWLELTVSDTGTGISQDDLARIFQPFYTTKAHGIGLGLPITRRLIEDHHGYLLVESQLGYGTTISIRLPLSKV